MSSSTKSVCTHPAVQHYSEDYQQSLHQAARHVAEAQQVGFDLSYVVQKARASYRACWKTEIKRARCNG